MGLTISVSQFPSLIEQVVKRRITAILDVSGGSDGCGVSLAFVRAVFDAIVFTNHPVKAKFVQRHR